jgi:alkylhydroperoxidase family enzyme
VEHGTRELAEAIKRGAWREAPDLSERDIALCTVAEKLSATPTRMVEEDWQPLRDLGFDDQGLLEVAHIVGLFNYLTRLADGMGLQLDPMTEEAGRTGEVLSRVEGKG